MIPYYELETMVAARYQQLLGELGEEVARLQLPNALSTMFTCRSELLKYDLETQYPELMQVFYNDLHALMGTNVLNGWSTLCDQERVKPLDRDYLRCVPGAVEAGWTAEFISKGEFFNLLRDPKRSLTRAEEDEVRPMTRFGAYDKLALSNALAPESVYPSAVQLLHNALKHTRARWFSEVGGCGPSDDIDDELAQLESMARYVDCLLRTPSGDEPVQSLIENRLLNVFAGSRVHLTVAKPPIDSVYYARRRPPPPSQGPSPPSAHPPSPASPAQPSRSSPSPPSARLGKRKRASSVLNEAVNHGPILEDGLLSKETLVLLPACLSYQLRSPPMGIRIKRSCVKLGVLANGTSALYADAHGVYVVGEGGVTYDLMRCNVDSPLVKPHGFCVKVASSVRELVTGRLDYETFETRQMIVLPDVDYEKAHLHPVCETPKPTPRNFDLVRVNQMLASINCITHRKTWFLCFYGNDYRKAPRSEHLDRVFISGMDDDEDDDETALYHFQQAMLALKCEKCGADSQEERQTFTALFNHNEKPRRPHRLCARCVAKVADRPTNLKIPCISVNQFLESIH
ncbi:protein ORF53 [Cyprinid herpesvirus 3]|uniref:ORF53L n=1 Tax=Cyprinid herpesvirus 3 TaxID=180230 RepID=A4FTG0_CYHV3|nr:ORF53L [Cyprinid herpesvirus 3]AOO32618.1 protein ORF53 [Cyprinid herpesvirus 3]AOO32775.1 protein ORF53 [Cyprinid herpesvirus 3]AOO32932.1 protein ORF53 [Cyprinid herpesvirus 3]AOO33088.1 protein ORF53 [Cyprinid herpesvirus 3]